MMSKLISWFRADLGSEFMNKKLYRSLRELVVILFAVVFGVGLSKLGEAKTVLDYALLVAVYAAVLLSWWGYNLGVIGGPAETNKLCYAIDVFLLVLYWFMIDQAFDLLWTLRLFVIMYVLYVVWELIRKTDNNTPKHGRIQAGRACTVNAVFLLVFIAVLSTKYWLPSLVPDLVYPITLVALTLWYRIAVGGVYSARSEAHTPLDSSLDPDTSAIISAAREAAGKARPHLSGYRVGAAIRSESGAIYTGCNVEFDNYSNTLHAEEVAVGAMFNGADTRPTAIAVYTTGDNITFPCGMCLQSLHELGSAELVVIACNDTNYEKKRIAELLPFGFTLSDGQQEA
jgi:cytidine deaminase